MAAQTRRGVAKRQTGNVRLFCRTTMAARRFTAFSTCAGDRFHRVLRPLAVQKATFYTVKGRKTQRGKPPIALQKGIFYIAFRRFSFVFRPFSMHRFAIKHRNFLLFRQLRLHTNNRRISVLHRVFAEQRPSHAPTEIKKKVFFSQELQGVNGSYRSLCPPRKLKDKCLEG